MERDALMYENILLDIQEKERVAVLTFNRPEALNALNGAFGTKDFDFQWKKIDVEDWSITWKKLWKPDPIGETPSIYGFNNVD